MHSSLPTQDAPGRPFKHVAPGKRRAPRACLNCRARKVRCDVARFGRPCGNCTMDERNCVVTSRVKRGKDCAEEQCSSMQSRGMRPVGAPETSKNQEIQIRSQIDESDPAHPNNRYNAQKSISPPDMTSSDQTTFAFPTPMSAPISEGSRAPSLLFPNHHSINILTPFLHDPTKHCDAGPSSGSTQAVFYTYYPFLTTNKAAGCLPQDFNFLQSEGCFHIPPRLVLDDLLNQYFANIHPQLPLLSEAGFWESYRAKDPSWGSKPKLSLLVFQAMLFAASNFASSENVTLLRHSSARDLRASCYRKAKLLYDFNTEKSPVAIAHAALLLSFWTPPLDAVDEMPNARWLSIAIENSLKAKAHIASGTHRPMTNESGALRRLWWCCIIRDRTLALGLRRSILLTRAYFDFDRNLGQGCAEIRDEILQSQTHDRKTREDLADIACQTVEFCVMLTDVLPVVFPFGTEPVLLDDVTYTKAKRALKLWLITSSASRYSTKTANNNQDHCITLFVNMMLMSYYSATLALSHCCLRAMTTDTPPYLSMSVDLLELSQEIQQAVSGITASLSQLNQLQLTRCLPITAVAYSALPLTLYVLDARLSGSDYYNPDTKMPGLGVLVDAMKVYYSQYHGVEWVAKIVRGVSQQVATLGSEDSPTNWSELLTRHTDHYVRLTLALDWCLRDGSCPPNDDTDQLHDRSVVHSTVVEHESQANEPVSHDPSGDPSAALDAMPGLTVAPTPRVGWDGAEASTTFDQAKPTEHPWGDDQPTGTADDGNSTLAPDSHGITPTDEWLPEMEADLRLLMENWDSKEIGTEKVVE
ncbi:hypothetical protein LCI18_006812 [Fusarium solani-melongenae]|uniref:Uncharacterized protein n=1 Tax=Fusarium solani subsp. cucurbitae TaxID=2747967 RepID=A0ACD3Z3X6_FUSSC|nr:hypothetical protein LCI18_006812 [Fusarium solani-melongenae]